MAFKRKLDFDDETVETSAPKQLKLVPFPSYAAADADVAMSDASSDDGFTWARPPVLSTASSISTVNSAPSSPALLRAQPDYDMLSSSAPTKSVGLIGCSVLGSSFQHNTANCTQLPKLRMACAAGPGRARTMWSACEQCGAIAMVDLD